MKIRGPDGNICDAVPVTVNTSREQWNEYLCDDGSAVRVKLVLTAIFRIDGMYNPGGDPVYMFTSTNVMSVSAPESMRKLE